MAFQQKRRRLCRHIDREIERKKKKKKRETESVRVCVREKYRYISVLTSSSHWCIYPCSLALQQKRRRLCRHIDREIERKKKKRREREREGEGERDLST